MLDLRDALAGRGPGLGHAPLWLRPPAPAPGTATVSASRTCTSSLSLACQVSDSDKLATGTFGPLDWPSITTESGIVTSDHDDGWR